MLDNTGAVVVKYVYDAWGTCKVTILDGTPEGSQSQHIGNLNPYRYRGYYYDTETGLYYLKTRYYDPVTCRFVTIDDLQYIDPETINGLNLYAYCANNPVMNIDPNGTSIIAAILIGVFIGAAVVGTGFAIYVGVTAYNNGTRGWDLFGTIAKGFFVGAVIGGIIGGAIAAFIYAAPAIGSFLGSSFTIGSHITAAGELAAITITGAQIAEAGLATLAGIGILFAQWKPGSWPGDDPTVPPGDGFEWRGKKPIGGNKGAWYNPSTGDSLHPDLNHPIGIDPHWDWINKLLDIVKRIFR